MQQNSVCRQTVTVNNENGLHMVPCSQIVQLARDTDCDVSIYKSEQSVDAKNIFDLLTLSAERGTQLIIEASGEGAVDIMERLVQLFDSNFESHDELQSD